MKMVSTIEDTKRLAIATKLADMKALQNLLISNEEKFIQDCTEDEIHKRLQDMLEDDRKNLGVLDTRPLAKVGGRDRDGAALRIARAGQSAANVVVG
jgi:hypothetical protein